MEYYVVIQNSLYEEVLETFSNKHLRPLVDILALITLFMHMFYPAGCDPVTP